MERESIERLTIDSAMGELNEDAGMLLAEYLLEHPDAKRWSTEMLADYNMAASAIKAKTKETPSASSVAFVVKPKFLSILNWRPIAKWAAVVIFASLIGIGFGRWSKDTKYYAKSSFQETEDNLPTKPSVVNILRDDGSFWHKKAIAFLEPSKYPKRKAFANTNNLWDRYRKSREIYHD